MSQNNYSLDAFWKSAGSDSSYEPPVWSQPAQRVSDNVRVEGLVPQHIPPEMTIGTLGGPYTIGTPGNPFNPTTTVGPYQYPTPAPLAPAPVRLAEEDIEKIVKRVSDRATAKQLAGMNIREMIDLMGCITKEIRVKASKGLTPRPADILKMMKEEMSPWVQSLIDLEKSMYPESEEDEEEHDRKVESN